MCFLDSPCCLSVSLFGWLPADFPFYESILLILSNFSSGNRVWDAIVLKSAWHKTLPLQDLFYLLYLRSPGSFISVPVPEVWPACQGHHWLGGTFFSKKKTMDMNEMYWSVHGYLRTVSLLPHLDCISSCPQLKPTDNRGKQHVWGISHGQTVQRKTRKQFWETQQSQTDENYPQMKSLCKTKRGDWFFICSITEQN